MDLKKGNWNPLEFNFDNFTSDLINDGEKDPKKAGKKRASGLEDKKFLPPPASKMPSNQNIKPLISGLGAPSPSNKLH
jgi:hypothetical protein